MRQFKDNASPPRLWNVAVNVGSVKRVKKLLDVDLLDITDGEPPLILRLQANVILLCDVLYALCQPECERQGVTDEQFGEALGGGALAEARQALMGELEDFFRQSGETQKAQVVRRSVSLLAAAIEEATTRSEAVDLEGMARQAVGKRFTESLESLESTLNPSLSAN